jgi:ferric-dicitrate binding protein FerR (iron transport regulator)
MNKWCKILALVALVAFAGTGMPAEAADAPMKVEIAGGAATVSFLTGKAWVKQEQDAPEVPLAADSRVSPGNVVRTGKDSRLEVELPDGSFLRFDENTSFVVLASAYVEKEQRREVRVRMILGKAWARVSRLLLGKGRFAISTPTAVAGVRGTVYRINLNRDRSAVVKVYDGEVEVRRRAQEQAQTSGPAPLEKPHPVAGPHPVSMEQWVYIVGALQQINIRPDGTAEKPFRFDIEADLNDWVRWNQMRDERIREMMKNRSE